MEGWIKVGGRVIHRYLVVVVKKTCGKDGNNALILNLSTVLDKTKYKYLLERKKRNYDKFKYI